MMESCHVTNYAFSKPMMLATPSTLPHSLVVKVYCLDKYVVMHLSFILQVEKCRALLVAVANGAVKRNSTKEE